MNAGSFAGQRRGGGAATKLVASLHGLLDIEQGDLLVGLTPAGAGHRTYSFFN